MIDNVSNSPDLSLWDYFLFLTLKTAMIFQLPRHGMKESMDKFINRSKRCFDLNGDYFKLKITLKHSTIRDQYFRDEY